jgi:ATP-dependent Clp protease, protease subunit
MSRYVPFVIEKTGDYERSYDIYSRLLEDRIIFLGEEITDDVANSIIAQLLLLDQKDSHLDICLYINSPGGSITAGLAIYDTIQYVRPAVTTVCVGIAASMAAVLLSSGQRGKRYTLPNSKIMIHQPRQEGSHGVSTVTEQEINLKVIKKMKVQLSEILAKNTGKPLKKILKDCELDKWLEPSEALEYGIIDEILSERVNNHRKR